MLYSFTYRFGTSTMGKTPVITLAILISVIAIIISLISLLPTEPTLNQILEKQDCNALFEWEEKHMFDSVEDLGVTEDQANKVMQLVMKCSSKVLENMFGK